MCALSTLGTGSGAYPSGTQLISNGNRPGTSIPVNQFSPMMATLSKVDGLDWSTRDGSIAYNVTVAELHSYFVVVGAEEALVHNTCGPASIKKIGDRLPYVISRHTKGAHQTPNSTPCSMEALASVKLLRMPEPTELSLSSPTETGGGRWTQAGL